ncbi:DUF4328 domain-containing protein [Actinomadura alba]|uniref:DUF4328 domain-containing protein n=1 Tax=Actinomadura alba TaxID=406431 RepID=A0ABR7M3J5_9ACTN|nr:DUF4328 domain-containing protein [Actinomadura alba]MBC6471295.1 DUF4328 domain-containing protein [Actinomadura alba]
MAWQQSGGYSYPSPYHGDGRPGPAVLAPVRGLSIGAVLGLCLSAAVQLTYIGVNVWRYVLAGRVENGEEVSPSVLDRHDAVYEAVTFTVIGATVLTAVPFIIWLFRVRANAEVISDRPHRWGRPWLVFSWVVPFANLWWPKRLVDDIWLASDPRFVDAPESKRSWLVRGWWLSWVLYLIMGRVVAQMQDRSSDAATLQNTATGVMVVASMGVIAAVLAALVVLRLSELQEVRGRELAAMVG